MAFNEAILTDERPNVFELLAEEQLREALRPALLYLTKVTHTVCTAPSQPVTAHSLLSLLCSTPSQVLARSRPELFFSGLWRSRDEVHLMLDSALQWIFLTLNGWASPPLDKTFTHLSVYFM